MNQCHCEVPIGNNRVTELLFRCSNSYRVDGGYDVDSRGTAQGGEAVATGSLTRTFIHVFEGLLDVTAVSLFVWREC